ncbi:hypothetical protein DP113_23560 [Brasilonema octagenarum UFV-E1]|uniref:Uncharacterized protein n=2 Tax=Brasilonema TaxID=383614 RepID=A0A856MJL6_9CYAN|nr:hypothetical protein [Brasilonema sennae]NMF64771.1 hypothetical protein [Brasilonema octagenarum UFV-OR1]QDL10489.1 hypothetical protein DP114_23655 [Brasilonema sennae CENA114]QDL16835.1 hypothetical protein DP113_23560 [Brasilonema octagenarum UFV-E1]
MSDQLRQTLKSRRTGGAPPATNETNTFFTPFGFASRLRRETLLQRWSHQIPRSGDPHQVLAAVARLHPYTLTPLSWSKQYVR